jgi:hypothetical protein
MVQHDVGLDAAFGTAELGNIVKQSEMVVESRLSNLLLKRNLCWRVPSAC